MDRPGCKNPGLLYVMIPPNAPTKLAERPKGDLRSTRDAARFQEILNSGPVDSVEALARVADQFTSAEVSQESRRFALARTSLEMVRGLDPREAPSVLRMGFAELENLSAQYAGRTQPGTELTHHEDELEIDGYLISIQP